MNPPTTSRRRAVQLALIAAFTPAFVTRAFGSVDRTEALFRAHRRAVVAGHPLLVLVAPEDQEAWYARGVAFGMVVNHGGAEVLAAMALCEVAVGSADDVATLAGRQLPPDTAYVLIETDRVPGEVRSAAVAPTGQLIGWEKREQGELDELHAHRDALIAVVLPDRGALARYVDQVDAAAHDAAALIRSRDPDLSREVVQAAGAVLALDAADGLVDRQLAVEILADAGRARWVDQVIPGSRWAYQSGCAPTQVEGEPYDDGGWGCGMGWVSERSRRMLWLYPVHPR